MGANVSEELPPSLRHKLLREALRAYQKRILAEKTEEPKSPKDIVLRALEDEKGKEILEKAERLYPEATRYALEVIARLIEQKLIKTLDALTLLNLLNKLGVPVKPDIRIKFVKRGKEVSFKEYIED